MKEGDMGGACSCIKEITIRDNVGRPEHPRHKHRWEDNTEKDFEEIGCKDVWLRTGLSGGFF
jgi:hypothetical protein